MAKKMPGFPTGMDILGKNYFLSPAGVLASAAGLVSFFGVSPPQPTRVKAMKQAKVAKIPRFIETLLTGCSTKWCIDNNRKTREVCHLSRVFLEVSWGIRENPWLPRDKLLLGGFGLLFFSLGSFGLLFFSLGSFGLLVFYLAGWGLGVGLLGFLFGFWAATNGGEKTENESCCEELLHGCQFLKLVKEIISAVGIGPHFAHCYADRIQ